MEILKKMKFQTFQEGASFLVGKGFMTTVDPVVVKHMLRTKFNDFNKFADGENFGCARAHTHTHTHTHMYII